MAVDNFLWPFYGYDAARTRSFPAPRSFGPPLRRGWSYDDFALLEFPPVLYHNAMFFIDYDGSAKAVNKLNGHLIWQRKLGTLSAASPAVDPRSWAGVLSAAVSRRREPDCRATVGSSPCPPRPGGSCGRGALPAGSESSPLVHG